MHGQTGEVTAADANTPLIVSTLEKHLADAVGAQVRTRADLCVLLSTLRGECNNLVLPEGAHLLNTTACSIRD